MTTQPVQTWASAEAVEQWRQGAERRSRYLGDATEQMFAAAGVRPGAHVLDLAAGSGDTTLMIAQRIGPTGSVLAVDISGSMLAAAEQGAREAGLGNVSTLVADLAELAVEPDSFDVAVCRLGLMFLPTPEIGLQRIRAALKPGGRLAALVWSSEERNPYMGIVIGIVREMRRLPTPQPTILRALSLSAPDRLEQAFVAGGFSDVSVRGVPIARDYESVAETLDLLRTGSSAQQELLRDLSESECMEVWSEAERRLQAFARPDGGVSVPGEALLAVGTK